MNIERSSWEIAGCLLSPLGSAECDQYLGWLLGKDGAGASVEVTGLAWALVHCDDGVTWGRYDAEAMVWCLGSQFIPEVSPIVRLEALQELRIFGESTEILIWRTDDGLLGRILRETEPPMDRKGESNPLRPADEPRILRGLRVLREFADGFTHVGDGTGAEQVLPFRVTEGPPHAWPHLCVSHYFARDEETGAVRVAASRLATFSPGGSHDA